jgi:DNA mismatch repair ATPase MutL
VACSACEGKLFFTRRLLVPHPTNTLRYEEASFLFLCPLQHLTYIRKSTEAAFQPYPLTMSPRRSSRARTTQPSTSLPGQTLSSSSSTSSGRADRSTRSHHKNQSPQKSTPPRSRSSEEADETSRIANSEPLQTRRRKREREDDEELDRGVSRTGGRDVQGEEDEEEEEEEITRCVCGNQDYPGPPVPITEQSIEVDVDPKSNIKDEANLDLSMTTSDVPSDEYGGLFIQCDMCKVWQHGGCVGIWDQSTSPEEYFCEQCRRDLHKITIGMNG